MKEKVQKKAAKVTQKEAAKVTAKPKGKKVLTILKMVEAGKTRKQIIDKLVSLDENISRKSNAGLVSHILTKNALTIESGTDRAKKKTITATA